MITYGSYLDENENLIKTAASVVLLDTIIALVAGTVIFSITFSFGQAPGSGPGLMFVTLPKLFLSIPFGTIVCNGFLYSSHVCRNYIINFSTRSVSNYRAGRVEV